MNTSNLSRLRKSKNLRESLNEISLSSSNIIFPYFVVEGEGVKDPIASMPGLYHFSVDTLLKDLDEAQASGITSILLFGLANQKDNTASGAFDSNGALQNAVRAIKKEFPELVVYTDVCMCAYTTHGHCGILKSVVASELNTEKNKTHRLSTITPKLVIDHAASAKILAEIARSHAEAGADFVSPSAMMDGQVIAIRDALNQNGFRDVGIMAYSAKYASHFYGPFRDALDSTPEFGDRKSYQLDFRNKEEGMREIKQDIDEGADIVMVKPALSYLDIIARAKEKFKFPLAAYNVSGEYSFIKKASGGDVDLERALALETLYSIKRAGADVIISYFGKQVKEWLM